jgi:hypothetical protein
MGVLYLQLQCNEYGDAIWARLEGNQAERSTIHKRSKAWNQAAETFKNSTKFEGE